MNMNGGFDWLNLPSEASPHESRTTSPTPMVSFNGVSSGIGLSVPSLAVTDNNQDNSKINNNELLQHNNLLADTVLQKNGSSLYSSESHDDNIPLSLTTQDLTLDESRTYIRWYSDILARTDARTITMNDVYTFLVNFKLPQRVKDNLNKLFSKIINSINIGEFFALLRLVAHALTGREFDRRLIKIPGPIPCPPSILAKKRHNDDEDEEDEVTVDDSTSEEKKPLDLDSFTQFMLTGERPDDKPKKRKKKLKAVKFSDQIVTDIHINSPLPNPSPIPSPLNELDYSLPMNQLLDRLQKKPDEEERQVLQDMGSQLNHFQNLNSVDTASIGGSPASIHVHNREPAEQLLKPNMTGPAQMSQYLQHQQQQLPDEAPLRPNLTGPYDMMKMFSPSPDDISQPQPQYPPVNLNTAADVPKVSLQTFTSQMTGNTASNTAANTLGNTNPRMGSNTPLSERPLPPPPVPASRRARSMSSPTPSSLSPVKPTPPPPPPSRRRNLSNNLRSPPPPELPPKIPNQVYGVSDSNSGSTADILDDLKELQAEVDRIRDMTGGF